MEKSKNRRRTIKKVTTTTNPPPPPPPARGLIGVVASFFFSSWKSKHKSKPSTTGQQQQSGKGQLRKVSTEATSKGRSPASSPANSIANSSFINMPRPTKSNDIQDAEDNKAVYLSINLGMCEGGNISGHSLRSAKSEGKHVKRNIDREHSASSNLSNLSNLSNSSALSSNSNISILSSLSGSVKAPPIDALQLPTAPVVGNASGKKYSPTAAAAESRIRYAARTALSDSTKLDR